MPGGMPGKWDSYGKVRPISVFSCASSIPMSTNHSQVEATPPLRLASFLHGDGCGSKIARSQPGLMVAQ